MTPLTIAAASAVLAALAIACVVHGVRVQRPTFSQVRAILLPDGVMVGSGTSATSPLHSLIERHIAAGETGFGSAAAVAFGFDPAVVASRCVVAFAIGAFAVVLSVSAMVAMGSLPLSPIWLVLALATGAAAAWVMWSDAHTKLTRRRREFRRATNDFIQLVAVGLTTDQSVEQAIEFALGVGDSEMFSLLRTELATAPLRGVPVWEALERLGATYGERELGEFGSSIERQGTHGVSITDTVNSLAASMRAKALDELEREADRANANLSGPTVGFVVTTIVFLAYPLAIRIGEAFGG
jgi:hypothetical protein